MNYNSTLLIILVSLLCNDRVQGRLGSINNNDHNNDKNVLVDSIARNLAKPTKTNDKGTKGGKKSPTPDSATTCPDTSKRIKCKDELYHNPVLCSNSDVFPTSCVYDNICLAVGGTGYYEEDCKADKELLYYTSNSKNNKLDIKIPLISQRSLEPIGQDAFERQIFEASKLLVNMTIERNLGTKEYYDAALGGFLPIRMVDEPIVMEAEPVVMASIEEPIMIADAPMMAMTVEAADSSTSTTVTQVDATDSVSAYDTNTQEANVDESDGAKSDGTHIYAAYGDEIKVWDTSGENVKTFTLPPTDDVETTTTTSSSSTTLLIMDYMPTCSKPIVQSLMLTSNRLVAFVSGYAELVRNENNVEGYTILTNYGQTRMFVFDKTNVATAGLELLTHQDVHGYFRSARMVGETIHAVTVSGIQTYYDLIQHVDLLDPLYEGMTPAEYEEAAITYALEDVIPAYRDKLINELCGQSFTCPSRFLPLVMWQDDLSGGNDAMLWKEGILRSYVSITSFNMATYDEQLLTAVDGGTKPTLDLSTTSSFFPTGSVTTYSSEEVMTLGGQGYHFDATRSLQIQQTYLYGFQLNNLDGSTTPYAYGSLPGYLLNQFSLDHEDGYLRVATTIRNWWRMPLDGSTVLIEEVPPMTENYVSVLKLEGGLWDIVGQTDSLGKEGETITAVRFFQKIAYVVTFRQTDPFYVIDLSNPEEETIPVLGELNITGFSQYMHPLNADASMLLALGQEADDTGRVLGLSLTIFNATNPTEPTALHRLVVENRTDAHSSSSAQWDHKAFRYFDVPGLVDADGYLIIPMTTYDWHAYEHFDGYKVYEISIDNGITEKHNITHVESSAWNYCYSRSILPERSFVFNGDVMTLKRHSVRITDLGTGDQTGEIDFVASQTTSCTGCYGYWLY